jgi:hypothetical protein
MNRHTQLPGILIVVLTLAVFGGPASAAQQALLFDVLQDSASGPPYPTLPKLLFAATAGNPIETPVQHVEFDLEGVSGASQTSCGPSFPVDLVAADSGGPIGLSGPSGHVDIFWDTESGVSLPKQGCTFEARLKVLPHPSNPVAPVVVSTDLIQQTDTQFLLTALATFQGGGSSLLRATVRVPAGQAAEIKQAQLGEQVENAVFVSWKMDGTGAIDTTQPLVSVELEGFFDPDGVIDPPLLKIDVGDQFQTISAAVAALADGGVLNLPRGTFEEEVIVDGKDVHFHGAGKGKTVLVNPCQGQGNSAAKFKNGGGGSMKDLKCKGNKGKCIEGEDAGALFLTNVNLFDTLFGVFGNYEQLLMSDSEIIKAVVAGVVLSQVGQFGVTMHDTVITKPGEIGILIFNIPSNPQLAPLSKVVIDSSSVTNGDAVTENWKGGVVVVGDFLPVEIRNLLIKDNFVGGISLLGTRETLIRDTEVKTIRKAEFTVAGQFFDLAWGLRSTFSGPVEVVDSKFSGIDNFGLMFDDSFGSIHGTTSQTTEVGLYLDSASTGNVDFQDDSNSYSGTDHDVFTSGALAVPAAPEVPED